MEDKDIKKEIYMKGKGETEHSKVLSLYHGGKPMYAENINWFFWHLIYKNFVDFCKACEVCQKLSDLKRKFKSKLHNATVPMLVMKLIW